MGRTSGLGVLATIIAAGMIVAGGLAISWARDSELPVLLALAIVFVLAPVVLALPAYLGMRREQSIVRNGTRLPARVVGCERVGRAGPNMCYAIARVSMKVELPSGEHADARVRRIIYELDHRDIADLVGRELWVYWHASSPKLAVPEARL